MPNLNIDDHYWLMKLVSRIVRAIGLSKHEALEEADKMDKEAEELYKVTVKKQSRFDKDQWQKP